MDKPVASTDPQNSGPLFRLAQWAFLLVSRFTRGMTLGVRGMVLDSENRVFLVRHSYVKGWHMPGGGVDAGESLPEALRRELREEGNIVVGSEPPLLGIYRNSAGSARDHIAVYVIRDFKQTAPHKPDREIVEARFFSLDALPEETTQATRRRIEEFRKSLPLAQDW
ncbi:MAG: NUDIX domain-containing protein [Beijerinckiaceae bacterium]